MQTCKVCGKRFRSEQALGGHVATAHASHETKPARTEPGAVSQEPPRVQADTKALAAPVQADTKAPAPPEGEVGIMDSIRALMKQGFSPKQIKEQFGYARATVDQVAAEFIKPENGQGIDSHDDGLPVLRKIGHGVEIITPEAILRRYMDGEGDEKELRGMMKMRAAMLMVLDLINLRKGDAEALALGGCGSYLDTLLAIAKTSPSGSGGWHCVAFTSKSAVLIAFCGIPRRRIVPAREVRRALRCPFGMGAPSAFLAWAAGFPPFKAPCILSGRLSQG